MQHPAPPDSLGNPRPPHSIVIDLPEAPAVREGEVVEPGGSFRIDLAASRKILVVRLDFIGDWVLMLPFLAGLRRSAPKAEITAVVLTRVHDLARSCRFVDRVVAVEAAIRGPVTFFAGDGEALAAFVADYAGHGFDLAVVPRWDVDFNGALRVADGSGARRVIGFSETCTVQRADVNRGEDRFYSGVLRDRNEMHEVEHKLGFLKALGGDVADRSLHLDLDRTAEAEAEAFATRHFGPGAPFLAVAPFAVGRKLLPMETTAALTCRLAEALGLPVAVIGSPAHADLAGDFMSGIDCPAASAIGLPLSASAALIGRAAALVGMDSGPAHIAAALGVPVAVVFSHPRTGLASHVGAPQRFRPWGDPSRVLVVQPDKALPPCVAGCEAEGPHCITRLDADALYPPVAAFLSRLAARAGRAQARRALA